MIGYSIKKGFWSILTICLESHYFCNSWCRYWQRNWLDCEMWSVHIRVESGLKS